MFWTIERLTRRVALALTYAGFGLCLAVSAGAEARPWVVQNGEQVRDLYLDGQLDDHEGRRWDVGIVPGARQIMMQAGDQFAEGGQRFALAGREVASYGQLGFWRDQTTPIRDGFEFAGDAARFAYQGVPDVLANTRDDVGLLLHEKPFAWGPRALWRGTTGLLVEAPVTATLGTFGTMAGAGYAVTAPVVTSARPLATATAETARGLFVDVLTEGIAFPTAKLSWHHPAFALAVLGPEPTPSQDGTFGLQIVSEPAGMSLTQPADVSAAPVDVPRL